MRMRKVPWQWFFVFVLMFLSILALGVITFAGLTARELLEEEVFRHNRTLTFQIPGDIERGLSTWLKGSLEKGMSRYSSSGDLETFAKSALEDSAIHSIHWLDLRSSSLHSISRQRKTLTSFKDGGPIEWVVENPQEILGKVLGSTLDAKSNTVRQPWSGSLPLDLQLMEGHGGNLHTGREWAAFWYFPLVADGKIQGYLSLIFDSGFLRKLTRAFVRRYPSIVVEISGFGAPYYLTQTGVYEGTIPPDRLSKTHSIGPVSLGDFFKPAQVRVYYPESWDRSGSSSFESYRVRYFISRYEKLTSFVLAPFCFAILGLILLYGKMRQSQTQFRIQSDWIENIAHDLQTPIHAIGSVLDLIGTQKNSSESSDLVKLVRLELSRMALSTRVFMQLARERGSSPTVQKVERNLLELLEDALKIIQLIHLGRKPSFEYDPDSFQIAVQVEPGSFRDVLINVLDNACKYSLDPPKIHLSAKPQAGELILEISDHGCGIPDGEETKIFQPFYRALTPATEGIQGNGLGLSIVRRIVENHGGKVKLSAHSPKGTTVEIRLPRD
jgi:signal transduction histidine kinase